MPCQHPRASRAAVFLRLVLALCVTLAVVAGVAAQTSHSIHDVMTSLPNSPLLGQTVVLDQGTPIVVGVIPSSTAGANGGFWLTLQTWDNDVNTAEGIFVAASSIPGCQVSVGQVVKVTGVIKNTTAPNLTAANTPGTYIDPSACTSSGTAAMSQGISLSSSLSTFGDALKYTGMAVTNPSFYAVEPTTGTLAAGANTVVSTGQFWATLGSNGSTNNHIFRTAGIAGDEYKPSTAPSGVATWSGNPQRVLIDTATFGGTPVDITVGQTITCTNPGATTGATRGIGVVDYTLGYARILIFKNVTCTVGGTVSATNSAVADSTHFKVGTLDVNTFLGTGGTQIVTTALAKATSVVTSVFGSPDIFALQQVGDQTTLQLLADAANAQNSGSTTYTAAVKGSDTINSGFLVNTATVKNAAFVESGRGATYTTAAGSSATLWDHPPLILTGEFVRVGKNYPVTVINVDLLPRDSIDDTTLGADIRVRRAAQAAAVSALVQQYQNAGANVIVAGNFNAYEYNDGYVDVVGVIKGAPAAATAVTLYQASSTTQALTDFTTSVAATSRYNIIERGNAASLEHILASSQVTDATTASASLASYINVVTQPHFTTDFAATSANSTSTVAGLTPHDGFLVNFAIPPVPTTATLTPTALNFGDVELGGKTTLALTFTNTSSFAPAQINITNIAISGTNAGDFTQTSNCTAVTQNQTCTINVTFAPGALGARTGTLTVTSDSTSNPTLAASLTGNGIDTTAKLSPTALTFGKTSVTDTSAAQTITFTNTSSQVALTVGTPTVTGDFALSASTCTGSIAAGGTCTLSVTFTPTVAGTRTGTLTVPNSSTGNATLMASLTGTGVDTTATLSPASATFPNTYAGGGVSTAQTFTVTNTSSIAITIKTVTTTGDFSVSANACSGSLAAGAACTVQVTFAPTASGARTGTLVVTNNTTANATLTATLTGTGLPTTATLSPTSINYGNVVLASTSSPISFVWTNTSAIPLKVTGATATGDYSVASNGCATVAAGASCTVTVVFTPTALGTRTGTLTVSSSASANPTLTAALTGRGVADVEADASAVDFGKVDVGYSAAPQTVTITNYTAAAIAITGVSITGDSSFAQSSTCAGTLGSKSSCTVTLTFTPASTGVKNGVLVVTTNDTKVPVINVALTGTGIDFAVALNPTSGTQIAGNGTVTTTLTITPIAGYTGNLALTCTTKAAASTCTLPTVSAALSSTLTQAVSITTTSQYTVVGYGWLAGSRRGAAWLLALAALLGGLLFAARRRYRMPAHLLMGLLALVVLAGGITGCGSKLPDQRASYTEAGTYTYTVTVTDGTLTHTATYTLEVKAR